MSEVAPQHGYAEPRRSCSSRSALSSALRVARPPCTVAHKAS